jgi:hypothetical protein
MTCLAFDAGNGMRGGFRGTFTDAVMATGIVATQVHYFRIVVIKCGDDPIIDIVAFSTIQ